MRIRAVSSSAPVAVKLLISTGTDAVQPQNDDMSPVQELGPEVLTPEVPDMLLSRLTPYPETPRLTRSFG
jgi:hypothetical protein